MWMLIFFGTFIGLLAAVSETSVTVTLVGLMFALIGGSVVGWYRGVASGSAPAAGSGTTETRLTQDQVLAVAKGAGYIAIGGVLGLLLGFALKAGDLFLIRPNVPLTRTEQASEKALEKLADLQAKVATLTPGAATAANVAQVQQTINDIREKLNKPPGEVKTPIVRVQTASVSQLGALSTRIHKEADKRKMTAGKEEEATVLENLSSSIRDLAEALENLNKVMPAARPLLDTDADRDELDRVIQGK